MEPPDGRRGRRGDSNVAGLYLIRKILHSGLDVRLRERIMWGDFKGFVRVFQFDPNQCPKKAVFEGFFF